MDRLKKFTIPQNSQFLASMLCCSCFEKEKRLPVFDDTGSLDREGF